MHRSRKSIVIAATALAGVLGMAGVAAAAHGRSGSDPRVRDDAITTTSIGGSGGTGLLGGSGGSGVLGGSGGSGGTGAAGGSGGTGAVGGSGVIGGSGGSGPVFDDHGVDPAPHDANDDHGNDGPGHDANDDRGNDGPGHDANDDHGNDGNRVSTTSRPGATTTTVAAIPNGPQTVSATGGVVTVDVEDGVLSLVSATPNAGFAIDKSEARSDRVEVEFRSDDVQSRVRVRIDGGRLRVETEDH